MTDKQILEAIRTSLTGVAERHGARLFQPMIDEMARNVAQLVVGLQEQWETGDLELRLALSEALMGWKAGSIDHRRVEELRKRHLSDADDLLQYVERE